jgi:hypothetical protein
MGGVNWVTSFHAELAWFTNVEKLVMFENIEKQVVDTA